MEGGGSGVEAAITFSLSINLCSLATLLLVTL